MRKPTRDSESRREESQLAQLLECERELAELMSLARADTVRQLDEARAAADAQQANLEASLGNEADQLRAAIRERTRARVREIHAEAQVLVTLFDRITDERVALLAEAAIRRLIRSGSAP